MAAAKHLTWIRSQMKTNIGRVILPLVYRLSEYGVLQVDDWFDITRGTEVDGNRLWLR